MYGTISNDEMLAIRDRYFAPAVMAPFADDMARRLSRLSNGPLLETAAGTGILTQAISSTLSAGLTIVSTDPNPAMIERAAAKPGMSRICWQEADPQSLPFQDSSFGIVTCHLGVAPMPDHIKAFQEARRVMKPTGRFIFSVLGSLNQNPVAKCINAALEALFPDNPPRYITHGLHGYANNETIDDDLTQAGFTDAIYTSVEHKFAALSARDVAIAYCQGTPLRREIEARAGGDTEPAIHAATRALEKQFGTGPIETTMRAHIVSAAG